MSNARSPRDVCSTTIGTRGLMVLASVSVARAVFLSGCKPSSRRIGWRKRSSRDGSGRPEPPFAARRPASTAARPLVVAVLLGRRPQLAARPAAGLDGIGVACSTSRSSAARWREVLAQVVEAAGLLQAVAELLGRRVARARRSPAARRGRRRRSARCPRPRRSRRGRPRARSACSASGLASSSDLLLGLAGDLQVHASLGCPGGSSECSMRSQQLAGARVDERVGHVDRRLLDDGVERRPRGTRPRRAARPASREPRARCPRAARRACRSRRRRRRSRRRAPGRSLRLISLTVTSNSPPCPASCSAW